LEGGNKKTDIDQLASMGCGLGKVLTGPKNCNVETTNPT
jgi:hypothetical protein